MMVGFRAVSWNRAAANDNNDRPSVQRNNSIEDTGQRANYVREHERELKWHKEAVGFTAATWLKRTTTSDREKKTKKKKQEEGGGGGGGEKSEEARAP